jgi:hypothetical protein
MRFAIPVFYKDWPSFFIYAYLGTNLFSSLFFSSQPLKALKSCIVIAVYISIYHVGRWLIESAHFERRSVSILKQCNLISALFGIAAMIASLIFGGWENIGVSLGHVGDGVPSIRSLSFEPNIFAIITGVILCLNIAKYIVEVSPDKTQLATIIFLVVCVLFAYTRSVYASLPFASLLMLKVSHRINLKTIGFFAFAAILILVLNISLSNGNFIKEAIMSKAGNMANFDEGNGLARVTTFLVGWAGFVAHPFFGNGTMMADTGGLNVFTGEIEHVMGAPGWLGGSLIQSLHDTGVIGALIILCIFISFSIASYKFYKTEQEPWKKGVLLGFFAGNIVIGITSQITSVFWVAFPFLYWAINMAFISKIKKQRASLITSNHI